MFLVEVIGGDETGGAPPGNIVSMMMRVLYVADGDAVEVVISRFRWRAHLDGDGGKSSCSDGNWDGFNGGVVRVGMMLILLVVVVHIYTYIILYKRGWRLAI